MENTWMPRVAGILDILAGGFIILIYLLILLLLLFASYYVRTNEIPFWASYIGAWAIFVSTVATLVIVGDKLQFMAFFMAASAIFIFAVAILAIVGGSRALQKKNWHLAMAGSIAALLPFWPMGLAAIVLTVTCKQQFDQMQGEVN
jgi:hypothetical protein